MNPIIPRRPPLPGVGGEFQSSEERAGEGKEVKMDGPEIRETSSERKSDGRVEALSDWADSGPVHLVAFGMYLLSIGRPPSSVHAIQVYDEWRMDRLRRSRS